VSSDRLAVQRHLIEQLEKNRDRIAPELREFVTGSTTDEVDQAVAKAIEKTSSILRQAGLPAPGGDAFRVDVQEFVSDEHPADLDVSSMGWAEYAEFRRTARIAQSGGGNYRIYR